MSKFQELNAERLGFALLKAYELGKNANVQKISIALKDNVSREMVGLEDQFMYDLFLKNLEDIEKEWN